MSVDARQQLAKDLLGSAYEALTPVQRSVIDLIATEAPTDLHAGLKHDDRTRGERLADRVAAIGGSLVVHGGGVSAALQSGDFCLIPANVADATLQASGGARFLIAGPGEN